MVVVVEGGPIRDLFYWAKGAWATDSALAHSSARQAPHFVTNCWPVLWLLNEGSRDPISLCSFLDCIRDQ